MSEPPRRVDYTSASRRRIENLIICAVLSFEIIAPLSYYLGARGYDERFSWRMFSTLRLRDCKVRVTETPRAGHPREVSIEQDVQLAWVRLLERMRWSVVNRYLRRRCDPGDIERVDYLSTCHDTDGQALPPIQRTLVCSERSPREESP